jgi:hypothetical protein
MRGLRKDCGPDARECHDLEIAKQNIKRSAKYNNGAKERTDPNRYFGIGRHQYNFSNWLRIFGYDKCDVPVLSSSDADYRLGTKLSPSAGRRRGPAVRTRRVRDAPGRAARTAGGHQDRGGVRRGHIRTSQQMFAGWSAFVAKQSFLIGRPNAFDSATRLQSFASAALSARPTSPSSNGLVSIGTIRSSSGTPAAP